MKNCWVCGNELSENQIKALSLIRSKKAKEAYCRTKGLYWGRPRTINVEKCRKLRTSGMTLQEIKNVTGYSIGGIHRAVRNIKQPAHR